jgi:hypothetical protein
VASASPAHLPMSPGVVSAGLFVLAKWSSLPRVWAFYSTPRLLKGEDGSSVGGVLSSGPMEVVVGAAAEASFPCPKRKEHNLLPLPSHLHNIAPSGLSIGSALASEARTGLRSVSHHGEASSSSPPPFTWATQKIHGARAACLVSAIKTFYARRAGRGRATQAMFRVAS